jgi:hypothetical protein
MRSEAYPIVEELTHRVRAEAVFALRHGLRIRLAAPGVGDLDTNESPANKLLT